jgi:hypothetical protein
MNNGTCWYVWQCLAFTLHLQRHLPALLSIPAQRPQTALFPPCMTINDCTPRSISPLLSVASESDLGSELSFESVEPQSARPPSTITMSSDSQLDGLSFHPTYSAKDQQVVFQVSDAISTKVVTAQRLLHRSARHVPPPTWLTLPPG